MHKIQALFDECDLKMHFLVKKKCKVKNENKLFWNFYETVTKYKCRVMNQVYYVAFSEKSSKKFTLNSKTYGKG